MQNTGWSRWLIGLGFGLVVGLAPARAAAQAPTAQTNKAFIQNLFFTGILDSQESPALVNQIASDSANAIAQFVAAALSSAPVASSSAGFSYVRDKTTGELSLKSESFGPTFAERPLTNGKGVWNIGANFQFSQTAFNGGFGTADGRTTGLPIFDNTATYLSDGFVQFITRRAFLESRTETFNFAASYGVTDRFDIGVRVPVVSLTLQGGTSDAFNLTRQFNVGEAPNFPSAVGVKTAMPTTSQSATGLGDVTVRLKYSLAGERSEGVALAADVSMPTGSPDDLLGAGKASVKLLLLASKNAVGPASVHANVGYTAGGLSDEINYVLGTDAALLSKKQLTASVSFLGRTLLSGALPSEVTTVQRTVDTGVTGPRNIFIGRFIWSTQRISLMQLAVGIKLLVGGQWLLDASVLLPMNERGFQPSVSPAIGLEHTWGR